MAGSKTAERLRKERRAQGESMNCKKCRNFLEEHWKFCPHCGDNMNKKFFGFFSKPKRELSPEEEMERDMSKMMKQAEGMLKLMGFPGKINIRIGKGPQMMQPQQPGQQRAVKIQADGLAEQEEMQRNVKETLEPLTKETRIAKGMRYVLVLPGVMSANDVKIRQFHESIEIRAYAKDRAYFKVIPIGQNSQIVEKKYQEEMLKLVIS
jgi:hypothetical protein